MRDETRRQIAALNNYTNRKRKSTHIIKEDEINSTGSFLSDLSLTQSEDDLLESKLSAVPSKWKKHRPSYNNNNSFLNASGKKTRVSMENRRSTRQSLLECGPNDKIVAMTKVHIPQDKRAPICAESVIESIPQPPKIPSTPSTSSTSSAASKEMQFKTPMKRTAPEPPVLSNKKYFTPSAPSLDQLDQAKRNEDVYATVKKSTKATTMDRPHTFTSKTFLKPESCAVCQRRIRFGSMGLKCSVCRTCTHQDCKESLKTPCVPQSSHTPVNKMGLMGLICDYAPKVAPMVPALIVLCVNEIESRGLSEVGLYRVSGSERDVKALKERFLRGKGVPNLENVDVHVLCGCIKDFLRSLREPLIPMSLWATFSNAADAAEQGDGDGYQAMYKAIKLLPQANRDTLGKFVLM
jgi:Rac GTPase-activating protein 1